eukprot:COSAG06_NODE_1288_length_9990_cov_17.463351_3_plen_69_part_00
MWEIVREKKVKEGVSAAHYAYTKDVALVRGAIVLDDDDGGGDGGDAKGGESDSSGGDQGGVARSASKL